MPVVGIYKGKQKSYLFCDNCIYVEGVYKEKVTPRQFNIQKFKNFVVAYYGDGEMFFKFLKEFDLDSFPEPVTLSFLLRNFYGQFLDFCFRNFDCDLSSKAIVDCPFKIAIMGKDYQFDISAENCYKVERMHAFGDDTILFRLADIFKEEFDDETLIKHIMEQSAKRNTRCNFPYLLVDNSDLNHAKVIYKDGSNKTIKLEELWRKN